MKARFDFEPIESGEQTLVPGVRPITTRDRLEWTMTQPKTGTRQQKPCDLGIFDVNARAQLDQSHSSSAPMSIGVRRHLRRRTVPKLDEMLNDLIQATQKKET